MTSKKQNNPHDSAALLSRLDAIKNGRRTAPPLLCSKGVGCECVSCLDRPGPGGGRSARFAELFRHKTTGPGSLCWCDKCLDAALARAGHSPWATPGARRRLRREGEKYLRGLQPEPWPSFALDPKDENDLRWFFNLGQNPKWISPKVQNRWKRINRCLAGGGARLHMFLENVRGHRDPLFSAIIGSESKLYPYALPKGFLGSVDRLLVHRDDKPPNSVYNPYAAERHARDRLLLRKVAECAQALLEIEYAGYRRRTEALRNDPKIWQQWPPFAVIGFTAFESLCASTGERWSDVEISTWGDVLLTDVCTARRLLFPETTSPRSTEEMQRIAKLSDAEIMDLLSTYRAPRDAIERTDEDDEELAVEDDYETPKERRRRERHEARTELTDAIRSGAAKAWGADGHALAPATFRADVTGEQTGNMLTTASEIAREYGLPAETARRQLEKLGCPGAAQRGRRAIPIVWLHSEAGQEFRSVMTRIMLAESTFQRALRRGSR
jgi:hypothetical protein